MTRHTNQNGIPDLDASELDRLFDEGVDMTPFIVEGSIEHPNLEEGVRKVNCALPSWLVAEAEAEARRLAVSRSAIINMWLVEGAEHYKARLSAA